MKYNTLFLNPDRFFEDRVEANKLRIWPALVVVLSGIAVGSNNLVVLSKLLTATSPSVSLILVVSTIVNTIISVFTIVFFWFMYSSVLYFVSRWFGGAGGFRDLMRLVGWSFVPTIVGGVCSLLITYQRVGGVDEVSRTAVIDSIRSVPPTMQLVLTTIGVAIVTWQAFLWVFAVKQARGLSPRASVYTISIPFVVSVLWTIRPLL
ncbi:Yip1 family protein [Halorientalis pallida]|uniref:YIP1 family protein n=1 Tax=Halorientalis pallida TaxID=2479928 RepID=A0A498KWY8_9EURY|nr:Yip1 family protein [Halorientalis pallida]RXK50141.1 YIP1 family protein [Halorientalis pallida]